jgi:hypothetical protein
MQIPKITLALLMALAACTYHAGADRRTDIGTSTPATPSAAPAPPEAKSPGPTTERKLSDAARNSGIKGIELFDRQVTVITVVCSSHTYDITYSAKAAAAFTPRPNAAAVAEVSRVDVYLRCHPKGFAGFESRCYATAEIGMSVVPPGARGPATLIAKGEGDAGAGALCEGGPDAIDRAMIAAFADASRQLAGGR